MIGMEEFAMSATISSIDDTSPPGVLIDMSRNESPRARAVSSAWCT
jgi:hypothetical protein